MIPKRIQRSREAGATHPPGTIFATRPLPLSNPFPLALYNMDRENVLEKFRQWMLDALSNRGSANDRQRRFRTAFVKLLKDPPEFIACSCKPEQRCHVDLIIEHLAICLANQ